MRIIGAMLALGAAFGAGWGLRPILGEPMPRIEVRRIVAPVQPAHILTCPVTRKTLEEYARECLHRKRAGEVKPQGE